jgi:hypothetical protein
MGVCTWVSFLADFTLEGLPVIRRKVDTLLHLFLDVEPASQTVEVDEAY